MDVNRIELEMSGSKTSTPSTSSTSTNATFVVGDRVCLKVVVGMAGTVTALLQKEEGGDATTVVVTMDWKLANQVSAMAYVQASELKKV